MSAPPKLDELITIRAMRSLGKNLADEASTTKILQSTNGAPKWYQAAITSTVAMARCGMTSALFAVDRDTLIAATNSLPEDGIHELPPLPFPKIIFEADTDDVWTLGLAETSVEEWTREETSNIEAAAICEVAQGEHWEALLWLQTSDFAPGCEGNERARVPAMLPLRLFTGGRVDVHTKEGWVDGNTGFARFLVEAVQFITARGVSLTPLSESRQVRRNRERCGMVLPPHIYWVNIDDAIVNTKPGHGEREFRHRWLVRGHWRHVSQSRRTWIRPYIKGRPGAPWKGRPVYRVGAS